MLLLELAHANVRVICTHMKGSDFAQMSDDRNRVSYINFCETVERSSIGDADFCGSGCYGCLAHYLQVWMKCGDALIISGADFGTYMESVGYIIHKWMLQPLIPRLKNECTRPYESPRASQLELFRAVVATRLMGMLS